jgi:flagellar basal body-associated protein FliL
MLVLGIMALGSVSGGRMRPLLFTLLVLAIVLLLAGAMLAIIALRNQRKDGQHVATLQQLENEID